MANASAYRDPLHTALERAERLEREKAELVALTLNVRRANRRRDAAVALAFAALLCAGPAIAWVIRGKMPPPAAETRTYEGRYTLYNWTTPTSSAQPTGPLSLALDPATGKMHGWATGPIGSVRVTGQERNGEIDVLAFSPEGDGHGMGSGKVVGDAMTGSFGVPQTAASARFVVEAKR